MSQVRSLGFETTASRFFSFRYFYLRVYVYVCVSVCHTYRSASRGQKSILGLPYNEPGSVSAGAKLWSSARTASAVLSPTEPYLPPTLGLKLKKNFPRRLSIYWGNKTYNSWTEECLTLLAREVFWVHSNTTAQGTPLSWCYLFILGWLGMNLPLLPRQHQCATASMLQVTGQIIEWQRGGQRGSHSRDSKAPCKLDGFSQWVSLQPPGVPVVGLRGIALLLSLGVIVFLRSSLKYIFSSPNCLSIALKIGSYAFFSF